MSSEELMAEVLPHPLGSLRVEPTREPAPELSVVVALYNEDESVGPLYAALSAVLEGVGLSYELVFVDDGSTDGTYPELLRIATADERARVVRFRRNFGQTAAMAAGFDHAVGRVIVATRFTSTATQSPCSSRHIKSTGPMSVGHSRRTR